MKILRFLLTRAAIVVGLLLLAEAAFRAGVWEIMAKPVSYSGVGATLKAEMKKLNRPIDFVSLGDSRAQYGFDHARFVAAAAGHGLTHLNLTMGGSQWMTFGVMVDWLQREHPELEGGIIATSAQEFLRVGNGAYELGIVYPFKQFDDTAWLSRHVPFSRADLASYGAYSALFQYRADIQEFVAHPRRRWGELNAERHVSRWLFDLPPNPHSLCAVPVNSVASCASFQAGNEADKSIVNQCKSFGLPPDPRTDIRRFAAGSESLPPDMLQLKDLRTRQIRQIKWKQRPIIVLMPVHRMWLDQLLPLGTHEWALAILKPLADEGVIELYDYTTLFDEPGGTDCTAFFDLYHQSTLGRAALMGRLLPQVEKSLYLRKVGAKSG